MQRQSAREVSIHAPPRGARHQPAARIVAGVGFQSTRPHEGRDLTDLPSTPTRPFQSTRPHEGRDRPARTEHSFRPRFNPRAPTRGATGWLININVPRLFQSTRPHEGRDVRTSWEISAGNCFNPRAPTRGATGLLDPAVRVVHVSIHAPPRGARPRLDIIQQLLDVFQSTRPHEGRDVPKRLDLYGGTVSIHAPPRGARLGGLRLRELRRGFNPRAPTRGATGDTQLNGFTAAVSIHAPPRGARRRSRGATRLHDGFNPRAPTRGATKAAIATTAYAPFQSTRPHEGRDQAIGR